MARKAAPVAGGGVAVEVEPARLAGWLNRFAARNAGLADLRADPELVTVVGGDGTVASIEVPFPPLTVGDREPVEALLHHVAGLGVLGLLCVRGGAYSVGLAADGVVLSSSTSREHLQGRTAAGGWSQQRYARRRDNQRAASFEHAAATAVRVLAAEPPAGLIVAGDARALAEVLADPRLARVAGLPRRSFPDIPEPRRSVLDDVAARSVSVRIVVRTPDAPGPGH